jgi:phosphate transport system substrate-binding protein
MTNDMNDEFLHRLRRVPSAKFLASLKDRLDRHVIDQRKARRVLFRTAILAALIGGSAVAVAFVAWRGMPHALHAAQFDATKVERSVPANNLISAPGGGAAQKPSTSPSAVNAAADQSRVAISVAGVAGIVTDAQSFARFPVEHGILKQPEFTQTSTARAIAMLCHVRGSAGADPATVDVAGADRRITAAELATCKRNGVARVTELRSGFEGVVLSRSKLYEVPKLSARAIYLALAAYVPDPVTASWIKNPYHVWNDIDGALSGDQIEILGPPLSSATTTTFRQTLMEAGCLTYPMLAAMKESDPDRFDKLCHSIRSDGVYRDYGTTPGNLVSQLDTYPNAMALLKFKEAADKSDTLSSAAVDGVEPSAELIAAGSYKGARGLYLYVNAARAAASRPVFDFVLGFERAAISGPTSEMSLVALDASQRQAEIQKVMTLAEVKL